MSRLSRTSTTAILWTAILTAQGQTLLDLKSQGRNVDFSGAVATKPFRVGTALPAVCNVGEVFFKSDAPPGSNFYACTATNTWAVQSGSGGSASLPATTNLVKGNGSGGAAAANPGTDYYKPGMVISSMDLPPNVAATDAQNTFSDPGNQYFGNYDVACDATSVAADNVLVKKDSTGKCVLLTTSDTAIGSGFVGLLAAGSATTNGRVRKLGVGSCSAYGPINTGDWIIASTHTPGYCEGSALRPPSGTFIVGRANGPAGATVPVDIHIDPNSGGGPAVTLRTNGVNNGSQTVLDLKAGAGVSITDDGSGGVTVAASGGGSPLNGYAVAATLGNGSFADLFSATIPAIPANKCYILTYDFSAPGSGTYNTQLVYGTTAIGLNNNIGVEGQNRVWICADATQTHANVFLTGSVNGTGYWQLYENGATPVNESTSAPKMLKLQGNGSGQTIRLNYYLNTDSGAGGGSGASWGSITGMLSSQTDLQNALNAKGDASTNTATSVDGEVALFNATTGKVLKRATGTGVAHLNNGVLSASAVNGADIANNAITSTQMAVANTRRVCSIIIGADNGPVLADSDIGPQGRQCFIPAASTVVEIMIAADSGAPSVLVRKNHGGTTSNLTSAAFATGASGAPACANASGSGAGIDGVTTCSTALSTTSLAAGDWIELASGTAGASKRISIAVVYTVN